MHRPTHRGTPWTVLLAAALLTSAAAPVPAAAQGRIENVRLGRHPGYQRLVLDLASADVAAHVTRDREQLLIEAAPPVLEPWMQRELEALGLRLEPSERGTRLIVDPQGAPDWTAFRLGSGSPRLVLDLGPDPPGLPPDAEPLPESPLLGETRDLAATRTGAPAGRPEPGLVIGVPRPEMRVQVRGITFLGLRPGGPGRDELLDLQLRVQLAPSGVWELARGAAEARTLTLRELISAESGPHALGGSVLQRMVERIAAVYGARGLAGTRVDILQTDVDRLTGSSGTLPVHITEPDSGRR